MMCQCVYCRGKSYYISLNWSEARKVRTSPFSHLLEIVRHKQPLMFPGHKIKDDLVLSTELIM